MLAHLSESRAARYATSAAEVETWADAMSCIQIPLSRALRQSASLGRDACTSPTFLVHLLSLCLSSLYGIYPLQLCGAVEQKMFTSPLCSSVKRREQRKTEYTASMKISI